MKMIALLHGYSPLSHQEFDLFTLHARHLSSEGFSILEETAKILQANFPKEKAQHRN